MTNKSVKVIFDTNVLIGFLIGKRLTKIRKYISAGNITIVTSEQLLNELRVVTGREKLKKYFPKESVKELVDLLEIIGQKVETRPAHFLSRDPKDNFLLDLIAFSGADYLVTGDKDLLVLNPFKTAQIISPAEFENHLKKWK